MSRDVVVAKRYAKALYDLASESGIVSDVESQLKLIVDALNQDEQTSKFLSLPNVDAKSKVDVLKSAFGTEVTDLVYDTYHLMVTRGRQGLIGEMYEAYTKIAGEALGQAHATVYSANELTDSELDGVALQFGAITGKKIKAEQIVEPALLGGIQVRIGDRLYDGSLSGKLNRLQKSFHSKAL